MQIFLKANYSGAFLLVYTFLLCFSLPALSQESTQEGTQENAQEDAVKKTSEKEAIEWHQWSDKSFALAQKKGKLVLLDIGAQWCQFCKKMDAVTYQDADVISIINKHYIALKADIEQEGVVKKRYEHFGVPGTIILTADKKELNKRLGYIDAQQMQWHLLGNLQDAPAIANNGH